MPPTWVSFDAPTHVTASADGSYTWTVKYSYSDADDYAVLLVITFTANGKSTTTNVATQANALTQTVSVGLAAAYKGKTFDYGFVLTDQGGLKSNPYTGTVTFD